MVLVHRLSIAIIGLSLGCGTATTGGKAEPEGGKAEPERKAEPGGKAEPERKAEPEVKAEPKPYVPTRALPEIIVTNPGHACPELPAAAAAESESRKLLRPYAVALRRLACEPELFGKTTLELRNELDLPAEADLEFSGLRGVRLQLPEGLSVGDVAAVFGIETPQIHLTWQAYHAQTSLGTSATTGTFDLWGPGRLWLGVAHEVDRYGDDAGKEKILPAPSEAHVDATAMVGMPTAVVAMPPDADAIPLVVAAMEQLAARPELLAKDPAEVAKAIGLEGERFRLSETSLHTEGKVTRGISIASQRTTLPAAALVETLGLRDAKALNVNREHDVWNIEAGGTTEIPWKGLELSFDLSSPEGDMETQPLGDLEITFMTIRPPAS
jgi:hypothetical protein